MEKFIDFKKYIPKIAAVPKGEYVYTFTIFVPAFNASKTIVNVLESIKSQTYQDFEVIIINDGSTDNTTQVVNHYIKDCKYPIRFIDNKINKHKFALVKQAIDLAKGAFFLPFDADDICKKEALEIFHSEYESIEENLKPKISGVTTLMEDQNGKLVGDKYPYSPFFSNTLETKHYYRILGDKWGFIKTDILRQIDFAQSIETGEFFPEGILWLSIANAGYLTKYVNIYTYTYNMDVPNSITKVDYSKKSMGFAIYGIFFLNTFYKNHLYRMPKEFLKRLVSVLMASLELDYRKDAYVKAIDSRLFKLMVQILWPFREMVSKIISK